MWSIIIGVLGILAIVLFFFKNKNSSKSQSSSVPLKQKNKEDLGEIQIFFASQTGTAAKMAQNFGQQLAEHGFTGVVIDLKNISHDQFKVWIDFIKQNQISIYFMSNTGEGDPPDNCATFMQILKGKQDIEGIDPNWKNMNYAVFGLGDTQYQHFNKIGIDTDKMLEKNGANKLYQIGLGDNNSSIEDDYNQWKQGLWDVLKDHRRENPYIKQKMERKISSTESIPQEQKRYLHEKQPLYANFRFLVLQNKPLHSEVNEDELDFKTKAGLKGKISKIMNISQIRQDKLNGSTLEVQVCLENQPEYQTAGNLALWPQSDPKLVQEVAQYFNLNLDDIIDIQIINPNKKIKLNFVRPLTIKQLLEEYIDIQFRITKGLLKKMSKFQSDSPSYFLNNSLAKTTEEYRRLSEKQFCYPFKLMKQHNMKLTFEDFVELSDSVGPRLFTIASSWKAQKNVIIAASLFDDGLISKHFLREPTHMKAQIRASTFKDFSRWKKAIFIAAGTGFAPFRGFLQEQELYLAEEKNVPIITLYFGCKYRNSDFIYREEIQKWAEKKVINRINLAFSREGPEKVYVQHLLASNKDELQQFINDEECALYICGSVGMGSDVSKTIVNHVVEGGKTVEEAKQLVNSIQKSGRLIKQLW